MKILNFAFLSSRLPWFRLHSRTLKKATGAWTPRGIRSTTWRDASRGLQLSADWDPRTPDVDRRPPESAPVSRKEKQLSRSPQRKDEVSSLRETVRDPNELTTDKDRRRQRYWQEVLWKTESTEKSSTRIGKMKNNCTTEVAGRRWKATLCEPRGS